MPLIEAAGVCCSRGHPGAPPILAIEDFTLCRGERLALLGPSGSGKSTCLDILAMTLAPQSAERLILSEPPEIGWDVAALWSGGARRQLTALRARLVGYILQTGGLLPFLSVRENVLLGRRLLGLACPGPADGLLAALGIAHLARRLPQHISLGERQRVAIARALAHDPAVVLADEPTASLDARSATATMELLMGLTAERGTAVVLVSHDRDLVRRFELEVVEVRSRDGLGVISRARRQAEAAP